MKVFANIVLLCFVMFLVAPTIVVYMEKDKSNTNICENCNAPSSSFEEIKNDIKYYTCNSFLEVTFIDFGKDSGIIIFENLSKHDLIAASIFIPPPNIL